MKFFATIFLISIFYSPLSGQSSLSDIRFDSALQEVKSYRDVDTDLAMSLAQKLLNSLDSGGADRYRVAVRNEIAVLLSYQEKHDEALALAYQVAQEAAKIGDSTTWINALHNIGIELYYLDELQNSQERFQEALALSLAVKDSAQIAYSYVNLGLIQGEFGNSDEEIDYYKQALELFEEMEDPDGIATTTLNLGEVFRLQRRFDLADTYIQKALSLFRSKGNVRGETMLLSSLAELYTELGEEKQAMQVINDGLQLCNQHGYVYDKIIFLQLLKDRQAANNQFAKAFRLAEEIADLQDSIYSVEKSQEMIRLSKRFELLEKEQEIFRLTTENELSKVEVEQSEAQRKNLLILFVVVLIATSILLYLMLKLSKAKRLIEFQNNQMSLQMNQRQRLFGIIAHDMKGPLSAFATLSGLLSTVRDENQLSKYLSKLHQGALTLKDQVNNLLAWTMAEQGQMEAEPTPVRVINSIRNTLHLLQNMVDLKGIKIENEVPDDTEIFFTETHFQIMLRNFLSNAIKYSSEGGSIFLSVSSANEGKIRLSIRDTGVGMSEEEMQIAMSTEENKGQIQNSEEKGTGLGLMISHHLLSLNGGSMELESTKGAGTTVHLNLPLA